MDDHEKLMNLAVPVLPRQFSLAAARTGLEKLALTAQQLNKPESKVEPKLRAMLESDIPQLLNVEQLSHPHDPYDEDTFKHWLGQGGGFVHEDEKGVPNAYTLHRPVQSRPGFNYVQSLAVHPEHRRKGIATALMKAVSDMSPAGVTLDVDAKNDSAKALYKKLGFRHSAKIEHGDGEANHLIHKNADDMSDLKETLSLEKSVVEAEESHEEPKKKQEPEPTYEALTGQRIKLAMSLHMTGDVQGVHLRATLHKLLEQHKAPGLAYNNARTGDVYAALPGDDEVNAKVLSGLRDYMDQNPKVHRYNIEESRKREKLQKVHLDDKALEDMFKRQGFVNHSSVAPDPAAYRRQWVAKRYRLQEDPGTHALTGELPALALKQLSGDEPIYGNQLTRPELYDNVAWNKHKLADDVPTREKTCTMDEASKDGKGHGQYVCACGKTMRNCRCRNSPSNPHRTYHITDKKCETCQEKQAHFVPYIIRVKRANDDHGPFTIAVDLDGTLAEKLEVHDDDKIGEPREDIVGWVRAFHEAGARIIIWTVRGNIELVEEWLEEHDVPYDHINENPDQPEGSSGKIIADVYWDDRGYNALDAEDHGQEIMDKLREETEEEKEEEPERGRRSPSVLVRKTEYHVLLAPDDILEEIMEAIA